MEKKRLLSDVVAAGGGTYSFVPFIYYFLAREQAPIIDPAARLFLRLSKRGKRGVCKPHPLQTLFNESLEVSRGQRNTCTVTLKMEACLKANFFPKVAPNEGIQFILSLQIIFKE